MPIRLTNHARARAEQFHVTRSDIEHLMAEAHDVRIGESAVEYDGDLRGMPLRVVVVKESDPPLVITVHPIVD
jgi:hypothetical protein